MGTQVGVGVGYGIDVTDVDLDFDTEVYSDEEHYIEECFPQLEFVMRGDLWKESYRSYIFVHSSVTFFDHLRGGNFEASFDVKDLRVLGKFCQENNIPPVFSWFVYGYSG